MNKTKKNKKGKILIISLVALFFIASFVLYFVLLNQNIKNVSDNDSNFNINSQDLISGLNLNITENQTQNNNVAEKSFKDSNQVSFSKPEPILNEPVQNKTIRKIEKIEIGNVTPGKYDIELEMNDLPVKKIKFDDLNIDSNSIDLKVSDVPNENAEQINNVVKVFAIDPTAIEFKEAEVSLDATGTKLYKCVDWNYTTQTCFGEWKLYKSDLIPGEEYKFILTTADPGFAEINVTEAKHLDEDYTFISDIYDEVKTQDNVWSEPIYNGEYVRATFDTKMTNGNVINLYLRNNESSNTYIVIYEKDGSTIVGTTPIITETMQYDIELSNMNGSNTIFDIKVVNEKDKKNAYLEFDYIHDAPTQPQISGLSFFMMMDGRGSSAGSDAESDEAPISLNDYGNSTEKLQTWDCLGWSAGVADIAYSCDDWICSETYGTACKTYNCTSWTASNSRDMRYCSGNYDCLSWNGNICNSWNCTAWTATAVDDMDVYCSGAWNCTNWNGGVCDTWKCTTWTVYSGDDDDYYCSGSWDCTSQPANSQCGTWACTAWSLTSDDKYDAYCSGDWSCTEFNGNSCDKWTCGSWTATGTNGYDNYCDLWNCTTWDDAKKICTDWDCPTWSTGATIDLDYYCSGGFTATYWKTYDSAAPTWDQSLQNQTVIYGFPFSYDVNASDDVEVDKYFINDTTNFQINSSTGLIQNKITLTVGVYNLNISVNDTSNKILSTIITVTVQNQTLGATLPFFMSSDTLRASSGGGSDSADFSESPIQLNDYGNITNKCDLWDCTAWSATTANDVPEYCSGGWNCTTWNGSTCSDYKCNAWSAGTATDTKYCSSGWDCTAWNGTYCSEWDCAAYTDSTTQLDKYCSGTWNCTAWNNSSCDFWNCTAWSNSGTTDRDVYCSGSWDCTQWYGNICGAWTCTAFTTSATADADLYCLNGWNCSEWNGNICDKWTCLTPTIGTSQKDFYCDRWNCSTWNTTSNVCEYWTCLQWIGTGTSRRNYYCSGSFNCIDWKSTADLPPGTVTNLNMISRQLTWIYWNWTNPVDADFNSSIIYLNEVNVANNSDNYYNGTGLTCGTSYTLRINTKDNTGNVNTTNVTNITSTIGTNWTNTSWSGWSNISACYENDTQVQQRNLTQYDANGCNLTNTTFYENQTVSCVNPPDAITNLASTAGITWLYWNWTNPTDVDFNSSIVYIGATNIANTSNNYYNATGLASNTEYTITINTKDNSGNVNTTNVTNTNKTKYPLANITITYPQNGITYNTNDLFINAQITGNNDTCWYSLNAGANTTFTCGTEPAITAIEGANTLNVYANNTDNILSSAESNFSVNTSVMLVITITYPANGTSQTSATPTIKLIAGDSVYGQVNYTLYIYYPNGTFYNLGNTGALQNGTETEIVLNLALQLIGNSTTYYFYANATDEGDNEQQSNTVYYTLLQPVVELVSPEYDYWDNDGNISFSFKVYDLDYLTLNCSLYIDDVLNQTNNETPSGGVITTFNVTGITEGADKTWKIKCANAGNNFGEDIRIFNVDKTNPSVIGILPAGTSYNLTNTIQVSANVTDNFAVSTAVANITYPNGTIQQITLSHSAGDIYNNSFMIPNIIGRYNITIIANDTAGNINDSETSYFLVEDNIVSVINLVDANPDPIYEGGVINITANVTDTIQVDKVWVEINSTNYTMTFAAGNIWYYNSFSTTGKAGDWNYTVYANDTSGNYAVPMTANFTIMNATSPEAGPEATIQWIFTKKEIDNSQNQVIDQDDAPKQITFVENTGEKIWRIIS